MGKQSSLLTLLVTLSSLGLTLSADREMKPVEVPYPGYLDSLNSTLISLISQLNVYKQYIDQAFKPLEGYQAVFPKPFVNFESKKPDVSEPLPNLENKVNVLSVPAVTDNSMTKRNDEDKLLTGKESDDLPPTQPDEGLEDYEDYKEVVKKSELSERDMKAVQNFYTNILFTDDKKDPDQKPGKVDNRILGVGGTGSNPVTRPNFLRGEVERPKCGTQKGLFQDVQPQWNVALGTDDGSGFLFNCGGILMKKSPSIIVASASCLNKQRVTLARLGTNDLYNISTIKIHPQFRDNSIYYDLGLIRLQESVDIDRTVIPCLHPRHPGRTPGNPPVSTDSMETIATDWKFKLRDGSLQILPVSHTAEIVPNSDCQQAYREYYQSRSVNFNAAMPRGVDSTLICARLSDRIDCQKNAGYQLISRSLKSPYALVGTTTQGKVQCDFMALPGIYTNITYFSTWIQQNSRLIRS